MELFLISKVYESLCSLTPYSINLIDENGKIRASKSPGHVGAFHEIAYELIKSNRDTAIIHTDDPESGVRESVYTVYMLRGHRTGVIGVYGPVKEIIPLMPCLKHALEITLEFELYKRNNTKKFSAKERFLKVLFNLDYNPTDLEQALRDMVLDRNIPRIPILLEFGQSLSHSPQIILLLENSPSASKQDLIGLTNDGYLFLLKTFPSDYASVMDDYKYFLGEYLSPALQYICNNSLTYHIYIGPIQNDILHYHQAYLYCRWMQSYIRRPGSYYFYDCIFNYLESIVSQNEYHTMFGYIKQSLEPKFIDNYIEMMAALIENDYNLPQTSQALHVHKNTLIYRLDKIRGTLNMNPLTSNSHRKFMECFYYYLIH